MENLDVFTAQDLHQRSGELLSDAERGQLSLIMEDGRPAIIAISFDQRLLENGVYRALALNLFEAGQLSLVQAAKVAALSAEAFMEVLEETDISVVDYPPEELTGEAGRGPVNRILVADAGPLIALARIGRHDLLARLYGSVAVPTAVVKELRLDSGRPGASALRAALSVGWLEVMAAPTDTFGLKLLLDPGEAEAILLAEKIACCFLLIDEYRGRLIARRRGIPIVGTGGFLITAKRRGVLESVTTELERLTQNGYRLAPVFVEKIWRLAGE